MREAETYRNLTARVTVAEPAQATATIATRARSIRRLRLRLVIFLVLGNYAAADKLRLASRVLNETPRAVLKRRLGVFFLHQKL
jgi:hypothetical protein